MEPNALLRDAFERVRDLHHATVEGLGPDELRWRPGPDANPIGWLLWHIARLQDDHVAELLGADQLWDGGLAADFGLAPGDDDIGYGHTRDQVDAVRPRDADAHVRYMEAVSARTLDWLDGVSAADLDRVVDRSYDPPVTMGVRLLSVLGDSLQHLGQAAYVRGLR